MFEVIKQVFVDDKIVVGVCYLRFTLMTPVLIHVFAEFNDTYSYQIFLATVTGCSTATSMCSITRNCWL